MKKKYYWIIGIAVILVILVIIYLSLIASSQSIAQQVKEECMRMNCEYTIDGKCVCR